MKKIAVVISGCGFLDGAEITEVVSALIALAENKAEFKVFAPQLDFQATDHITGEPTKEQRSILKESARITRGKIFELSQLETKDFDGLMIPGGYGVAQHLCEWAQKGAAGSVNKEIKKCIEEFHDQGKPICATCIAPALVAQVLGPKAVGLSVTIGKDTETAKEIEKTGCTHVECSADDYISDREAKVITTPAYMLEVSPYEVFIGIQKATKELVEMA